MNDEDGGRRGPGGLSENSYRLSVLLAALVAALILGGFLFGMVKLGVVNLPFRDGGETEKAVPDQGGDIPVDFLRPERWPDDAAVTYDIMPEDYLAMLSEAPYIDEYEITFEVTVSSPSSKSTEEHHLKKTASGFTVDTYREKRLVRRVRTSKDNNSIIEEDHDGGRTTTRAFRRSDGFTMESEIGIPSLDSFIGANDIYDLEITLVRTQSLNAFHVTYKTVSPRMTETMLVSLDHGLILMAQTTAENGEVIYSAAARDIK
ncbi:MAG: hypothetical protein K6D94_01040 [Clostridiales bacterium]|nr:hypothetical protein [Clostridiales bacterium]